VLDCASSTPGDEVVDPLFDGAVHLVRSRVGLVEGDRRVTGRSHDFTESSSPQSRQFRTRRTPRGANKTTSRVSPEFVWFVREPDYNEVLEILVEPLDVAGRVCREVACPTRWPTGMRGRCHPFRGYTTSGPLSARRADSSADARLLSPQVIDWISSGTSAGSTSDVWVFGRSIGI